MKKNTDKVQKIIESISKTNLFQQAFTHTSYCNESNRSSSYEILEFLGDSVLNFYTSLFIYRNFPDFSEGQMSKLKQLMVQESTLAHLSKEIRLNEHLLLGAGEIKNGGMNKSSILADIFESFVATLYLEKGSRVVFSFLKLTLFTWVKGKETMTWDYKSQLQEYCQARKETVIYRLKDTIRIGNHQSFVMEVINKPNTTFCETGEGRSKKEAEQVAAAKVIKSLGIGKE